jgi:Na+/proline symporter
MLLPDRDLYSMYVICHHSLHQPVLPLVTAALFLRRCTTAQATPATMTAIAMTTTTIPMIAPTGSIDETTVAMCVPKVALVMPGVDSSIVTFRGTPLSTHVEKQRQVPLLVAVKQLAECAKSCCLYQVTVSHRQQRGTMKTYETVSIARLQHTVHIVNVFSDAQITCHD